MQRVNKCHAKAVENNRPARIAHAEIFKALATEPTSNFWVRDDRCAMLFGDFDSVADMVAMTVGQCNMRDTLRCFFKIDAFGARVSIDEWIDQNDRFVRFNTISSVAQPGDFHCSTPCGSIFSFKTDITTVSFG